MTRFPNEALIGQPGSRRRLATPALVIDLDALRRNIEAMAAFARERGLSLRPHAKTHKSVDIARMQMAAGAIGLCCAKLGEAEALCDAGLDAPILITSPIVGESALTRLEVLRGRCEELSVVVDSLEGLDQIARALATQPTTVFIDVDPGQHRTGAASPEAVVQLAGALQGHGHLQFGGLQFFSGPSQHIEDFADRSRDVAARTTYLASVIEALHRDGPSPPVITGGGTGTHYLDAELGVMTELQVGSYIFMDDQYLDCQLYPQPGRTFETALFIDTRVISSNHPGMATVDAGVKASTGSTRPPRIAGGAPVGSRYEYLGDEHGAILIPEGAPSVRAGSLITLRSPHCDPTVNLHQVYHVVQGGELVDIWQVTARGHVW